MSEGPPGARVSVVISTYDRLEYLEQALRSVLAQTFQDFDVLVWDDAGPVDPGPVLARFDDERISYFRNDVNLGCLRAAVASYRTARGEYIAHLDDDDEWAPDYLAELVAALDAAPEAGLAFCDHWMIDEQGAVDEAASEHNSRMWGRDKLRPGVHRPGHPLVVSGAVPTSSAAVVRRAAFDFEEAPAELHEVSDRWIAYLASRNGGGVAYVPKRLVRYRRHGRQLTEAVASSRLLNDTAVLYRTFIDDPRLDIDRAEVTASLALTLAILRWRWRARASWPARARRPGAASAPGRRRRASSPSRSPRSRAPPPCGSRAGWARLPGPGGVRARRASASRQRPEAPPRLQPVTAPAGARRSRR